MITHTIAGPLPAPLGEYAAGYLRPGSGQFVPLVTGLPSAKVARDEARRLDREAKARQTAAFVDHNARRPSSEWYRGEP